MALWNALPGSSYGDGTYRTAATEAPNSQVIRSAEEIAGPRPLTSLGMPVAPVAPAQPAQAAQSTLAAPDTLRQAQSAYANQLLAGWQAPTVNGIPNLATILSDPTSTLTRSGLTLNDAAQQQAAFDLSNYLGIRGGSSLSPGQNAVVNNGLTTPFGIGSNWTGNWVSAGTGDAYDNYETQDSNDTIAGRLSAAGFGSTALDPFRGGAAPMQAGPQPIDPAYQRQLNAYNADLAAYNQQQSTLTDWQNRVGQAQQAQGSASAIQQSAYDANQGGGGYTGGRINAAYSSPWAGTSYAPAYGQAPATYNPTFTTGLMNGATQSSTSAFGTGLMGQMGSMAQPSQWGGVFSAKNPFSPT